MNVIGLFITLLFSFRWQQILLPMQDDLLGKSVRVKVKSVTKFSMIAELLDDQEKWRQAGSTTIDNVHEKISKAALESTETNGTITNSNNNDTAWTSDDNKNAAFMYAMIALFLAIVYRYTWKFLNEFIEE